MAFTFNTRYKPKTTREYTKSDLTVYDSAAGNPNALTIYGKSEVVGGAIVSAGEGWATVDLGTLTWTYVTTNPVPYFSTTGLSTYITKPTEWYSNIANRLCANYKVDKSWGAAFTDTAFDKYCCVGNNGELGISDSDYTNATAFKTAMSGVMLCYQLADPTQGNAIAVKTDNGTGINGTMATFTTGTPLRCITGGANDIMSWDGSAGAVVKNCSEVDLGTLTWSQTTGDNPFFYSNGISNKVKFTPDDQIAALLIYQYTPTSRNALVYETVNNVIAINNNGIIQIRNTAYTNPEDFITAMSGVKLIYELASPTLASFTAAENTSFAALETYSPYTHFTNNANADMRINYTIKTPTI